MQRLSSNTLSHYLMNMFTLNCNVHAHNTRTCHKFHRLVYNNDLSKFSLRFTGPELWNNLDFRYYNIKFNNTFNRQYKKYLIDKY